MAIALLAASLTALAVAVAVAPVVAAALVGIFTAFNMMEAILPSLVTKLAPLDARGADIRIYSSSQFLGISFAAPLAARRWHLAAREKFYVSR